MPSISLFILSCWGTPVISNILFCCCLVTLQKKKEKEKQALMSVSKTGKFYSAVICCCPIEFRRWTVLMVCYFPPSLPFCLLVTYRHVVWNQLAGVQHCRTSNMTFQRSSLSLQILLHYCYIIPSFWMSYSSTLCCSSMKLQSPMLQIRSL